MKEIKVTMEDDYRDFQAHRMDVASLACDVSYSIMETEMDR